MSKSNKKELVSEENAKELESLKVGLHMLTLFINDEEAKKRNDSMLDHLKNISK